MAEQMTDNIIQFPMKKSKEKMAPKAVTALMIKAAFDEANKYGYKLETNPEVMLDFEAIFKLINASVSREANVEDSFQVVLDKLTGADQE